MQAQRWQKIGIWALLVAVVLFVASWWAGQRPYITPGTHEVFRMDSTLGAILEFLVVLVLALLRSLGQIVCDPCPVGRAATGEYNEVVDAVVGHGVYHLRAIHAVDGMKA